MKLAIPSVWWDITTLAAGSLERLELLERLERRKVIPRQKLRLRSYSGPCIRHYGYCTE